MLVKVFSAALMGIDAITITVEVNVSNGIQLFIVGLPDNAVKESQQRIMAAFDNNGYKMPGKKIVVNMAPASIRKEGSYYDLPIAMAILAATEQIDASSIGDYMIMGELSLDGVICPIKGALPMAITARSEGFKGFILPQENAGEAAVVNQLEVYGARNIKEVIDFFNGENSLGRVEVDTRKIFEQDSRHYQDDFANVRGQEGIKRALEVAAAGGHNILLVGPPGAGKSMLAKRIPSILPDLSLAEALETTKIHSVAGKITGHKGLVTRRPFRSPHHTVSDVAIVGGGANPQPGEISLAHNGVLFLDELPEYNRSVLEVMRQPLEENSVHISRSKYSVTYPANFMLVASMNPCPCGYYTHPSRECGCNMGQIMRYQGKVSGPLMDRIDIQIEVDPVDFSTLAGESKPSPSLSSSSIKQRVERAREIQQERFAGMGIYTNSKMSSQLVEQYCQIDDKSKKVLQRAMEVLSLSARGYHKILKIARTIADLANSATVEYEHVTEALQYRSLDKNSND